MGFDAPIRPSGYAWWYVDGLSPDGRHGITLIAFIGSVFSPYYARARRRGPADPVDHCALNVALYGGDGHRWAMTERGAGRVSRAAGGLEIGPSSLTWDGTVLTLRVDEWTTPWPSRIRGTVRLHPEALTEGEFALDADGRHRWRPVAPCATIEVELDRPALRWSGPAYFDINTGDAPLERDFSDWDWSRAALPGRTAILYDIRRRDGKELSLALSVDRHGRIEELERPPAADLPLTLWRLPRRTRADRAVRPLVRRTMEDAPFYSRSLIDSSLLGMPVRAIHETLSLDRFRAGWVRGLLPFRMPRFDR